MNADRVRQTIKSISLPYFFICVNLRESAVQSCLFFKARQKEPRINTD
jgi:hypothetical protein